MSQSKGRIYCSGPLFCPEELASMRAIAEILEGAGYATFLPQRDGVEPYVLPALRTPGLGAVRVQRLEALFSRAVFALDVYEIVERADAVVLNLNGRVPDEGACIEAGVAFAAGKPVVLYKRDVRSVFRGMDNAMILGVSSAATVEDLSALPEAVDRALDERARRGEVYYGAAMPPRMRETVSFGRRVAWVLRGVHKVRRPGEDPEAARVRALVKLVEGAAIAGGRATR